MNAKQIPIIASIIILLMAAMTPCSRASTTTVDVTPQSTGVTIGQVFQINVTISQVTDLAGWDFKLYYSNQVLNAVRIDEGPFLQTAGATLYILNDFDDSYNATHGRIWAASALIGQGSGVNGNGTLATITFNAKSAGNSILHLADTDLVDSKMPPNHISHVTVDGTARVVWGLRDVAITNITPTKNVVGQGYTTDVNVTVENQGLYSENFNVTLNASRLETSLVSINLYGASESVTNGWGLSADGMTIPGPTITVRKGDIVNLTLTSVDSVTHNFFIDYNGDQYPNMGEPTSNDFPGPPCWNLTCNYRFTAKLSGIFKYYSAYDEMIMKGDFIILGPTITTTEIGRKGITLTPGQQETLTFVWNTTGFSKAIYNMTASADTVPGETDTADNTLTAGAIQIAMVGDVNGDGVIDVYDLITVAVAYGSVPGDQNWNSTADINDDDIVDIYDLIIVAVHYGEADP